MWQQQTAGEMSWESAITYCEDLSLGGYSNWRLPNRNELQSLMDYTRYNPAIDTIVFPGTVSYDYWSSTTSVDHTSSAWCVDFGYGFVNDYDKSGSYYVRAVRSVQSGTNDLCPLDPYKTNPGICGCGTPDIDSDGDGTLDCNDGCINDPSKTTPGVCDCGVADTDTDTDGTPECNDLCPDDSAKTLPGLCGCGVAETDTDNDGTPDCNDGCNQDPLKTGPGVCGCGIADTDTDNDGTSDCNDLCPADPDKTAPGLCGCGIADTDTDNDGTSDCDDLCPADSAKTQPGLCGCGVVDTDSDTDGTPDCLDGCLNDPGKIAGGVCGCGTPDTDSDGDTVPDCNDGCPSDPVKTAPGICGCGTPDTDSDGDSIADCEEITSPTITFKFVNTNGEDLSGTGNERVYVIGFGWKADGEQIIVDPGTTISYRVYYKQGSTLCWPWLSHLCTATATISVLYQTMTMDFEDQTGDLDPAAGRGTGNERVYIDQVGYKADGEMVAVPLSSSISYSAVFKEASALTGPKTILPVDDSTTSLLVPYRNLTMDFEDQTGDLNPAAGRGTGNERVSIDYVGYKADGESVTVPLSSTINYRPYFSEGSVLYGPKNVMFIDDLSSILLVRYHTLTMDLEDQSGDLDLSLGRGTQ